MAWTIPLDIQLIRESAMWPVEQRKQLAMIVRLLEKDGPSALSSEVQPSSKRLQRNLFARFPTCTYRLTVEVLGYNTAVLREAVQFDLPSRM